MPKLSDTMSEGTIVRWHKKEGDAIAVGDVIADVETDKATMEMEAFDDGVLKEIYVKEGGKVKIGDKIALVLGEGEKEEAAPAKEEKAEKAPEAKGGKEAAPAKDEKEPAAKKETASAPKSDERVKASPLAKKIAAERGVSLSGVTGTGPGNRVVAKDVPAAGSQSAAASSLPRIEAKAGEGDLRLPVSGMRKTIAERLLASKTQIPHFYLSVEINAGPLMKLRKEANVANEAAGFPKLTVNDFILLAVARGAAKHPMVNSAWAGETIIQYASVNLAVAVAVEDGLITPVIRDAQKMGLREISAAVKDVATRARSKKLKPEEYQGGTITVSNLGSYGIEQFCAIINPPQAAIIAVGAVVKKPVVNEKNEIVVGERMTITLSGDHRVVDGAVGAEFVSTLRKLIENPALMLF